MSQTMRKSWRQAARMATMQRDLAAAQTRSQVIATLHGACAPLSITEIAGRCSISYDRSRRALETLTAMHVVIISGPKNNQRFALTNSGMGEWPGGPASESAAEGLAGSSPTSAARPGRAAA